MAGRSPESRTPGCARWAAAGGRRRTPGAWPFATTPPRLRRPHGSDGVPGGRRRAPGDGGGRCTTAWHCAPSAGSSASGRWRSSMFRRVARHFAGNGIAYLALFIALSGTASAAAAMWTGQNIEDGSLTGADIQDGSISDEDLSTGAESPTVSASGPKEAWIPFADYQLGCDLNAILAGNWIFDDCTLEPPALDSPRGLWLDASRYPDGTTFQMKEIFTVASSGEVCVRLYDLTAQAPVAGSELCAPGVASAADFKQFQKLTAPFALPAQPHVYVLQTRMGADGCDRTAAECQDNRVKVPALIAQLP